MPRALPFLALGLALAGCAFDGGHDAPPAPTTAPTTTVAAPTETPAASPVAPATPAATAKADLEAALQRWRADVRDLSGPAGDFFSDNTISNETSYLQVAAALQKRAPGGVYLGVGPEQNFSYIALTSPERAYLLDIRSDNLVLHRMHKALFELAPTRVAYLAMLVGRTPTADTPPIEADVPTIVAYVEGLPRSRGAADAIDAKLLDRIEADAGHPLEGRDLAAYRRARASFTKGGTTLRFVLKTGPGRRYPSLGELLEARTPAGKMEGYLADEARYANLRRMQQEHRIVPLVGDFAGSHALAAIAKRVKADGQRVRYFYVSNVEQYLLAPEKWRAWTANVTRLPAADDAVFIRAYLDQGERHRYQLKGHRTATVLQPLSTVTRRKAAPPSLHALSGG